jgi:deoxyribonuclease-2
MPACAHRPDADAFGHTKGVLAFDTETKTAFWLVHSWPKHSAPRVTCAMSTPDFGQTYLCLALSLESAEKLAVQMIDYQEPQTYLPRPPKSLNAASPLAKLSGTFALALKAESDVVHLTTR